MAARKLKAIFLFKKMYLLFIFDGARSSLLPLLYNLLYNFL